MRNKSITFDGANVVLTGATRGIGKALCGQLIAEGATVAAIARDEAHLRVLQQELGERVIPFPCDLSRSGIRRQTIDDVVQRFNCLDGLINNAGIQTEMSFVAESPADREMRWTQEIAINLEAPIHLISGLAPSMRRSTTPFVVNVTSGLAIAPKEAAPVYCATKAGLRSFTKALRYQSQSSWHALLVVDVILPLVDTDMTLGRGKGKIPSEKAAAAILSGLRAEKEEVWVAKAKFLPWLHRISPRMTERILR